MASSGDSLDTLIVKVTNPLVEIADPVLVASFCERVTHEFEGSQIASRLLAYRIHSPQEKEALHALDLLEQCVKSCGPSFHNEIGKFRFLNEMIKLVSPRYLAHRTSNVVKQRILDILYTWTIDLKTEPKIAEAYEMLKKQGVIRDPPKYRGLLNTVEAPPPRPSNPIFDDAEKQALLQKLLRSKNAEDLEAANRLIKSMVREEERRQEVASRRQLEMETVNSNIRLLQELLDNFEANGATAEEMELCKELASNCDRLRPNLSQLAAETDDKEEALADILRTSDELGQILERFHALMKKDPKPTVQNQASSLAIDLLDLGSPEQQHQQKQQQSLNYLDEQLLSLGLDDPLPSPTVVNVLLPQRLESSNDLLVTRTNEEKGATDGGRLRGLEELDVLGETLLKQHLPSNVKPITGFQKQPEKVPLNVLAKQKLVIEPPKPVTIPVIDPPIVPTVAPSTSISDLDLDVLVNRRRSIEHNSAPQNSRVADQLLNLSGPSKAVENSSLLKNQDSDVSLLDGVLLNDASNNDDVQLLRSPVPASSANVPPLGDIIVKLENIKPSSKPPLIILAQPEGLNVTLHAAYSNVPKNVSVFVISTTSCSRSSLTNYTFQAVVPKGCRVKLHPPSDNKLPAFNPFLPPPAITQIMLIATPNLDSIELKYVVSYELDGETITEMGNISDFTLLQSSN